MHFKQAIDFVTATLQLEFERVNMEMYMIKINIPLLSWIWWHKPESQLLRRLRQENCKLKATLGLTQFKPSLNILLKASSQKVKGELEA